MVSHESPDKTGQFPRYGSFCDVGFGFQCNAKVLLSANILKVSKILNDRHSLAAKSQVDEIRHIEKLLTDGGSLKLRKLVPVKAPQPLGEIVQLIHIGFGFLQPFEDRIVAIQLRHKAVTDGNVSDSDGLQLLIGFGVTCDGEFNGNRGKIRPLTIR